MSETVDSPPAAAPATAPAPAVEASQDSSPRRGFLATLLGSGTRIAELESHLAAEQAAHAQTRAALATAQGRIAEFEALEAQLEREATAAQAAATEAQAAAAAVPQQVAQQVAAVVEGLGVPEAALPAQESADQSANEMSFGDFQDLSHQQRNEFIRKGGKIAK